MTKLHTIQTMRSSRRTSSVRKVAISISAVCLALAPGQYAAAQFDETSEMVSALSDLAAFADENELATSATAAADLGDAAKKLAGASAALGVVGAGLGVVMLFSGAESEGEVILGKLDAMDTKLDDINDNISSSFEDLAKRDEYTRLVDSIREEEREIDRMYSHWLDHQKAVKDGRPSKFETSESDMDFSRHVYNLATHCKDTNRAKAPQLFDIVEKQSHGNYELIGSWGSVIFERLMQSQLVATFLKSEQILASDQNPGEAAKKQAALDAAEEVNRDYKPLWDKCEAAYNEVIERTASVEGVKKNADAFLRLMLPELTKKGAIKDSGGRTNGLFHDNGRPDKSGAGTSYSIASRLKANYPGLDWIVLVFAVSDYDENFLNEPSNAIKKAFGQQSTRCHPADRTAKTWQPDAMSQFLISNLPDRTIQQSVIVGPITRTPEGNIKDGDTGCHSHSFEHSAREDSYSVNVLAHFFKTDMARTEKGKKLMADANEVLPITTAVAQAQYISGGSTLLPLLFTDKKYMNGFFLALRGGLSPATVYFKDTHRMDSTGGFDIFQGYVNGHLSITNIMRNVNVKYVYVPQNVCSADDWDRTWTTAEGRTINLVHQGDGKYRGSVNSHPVKGVLDPFDECVFTGVSATLSASGNRSVRTKFVMTEPGKSFEGSMKGFDADFSGDFADPEYASIATGPSKPIVEEPKTKTDSASPSPETNSGFPARGLVTDGGYYWFLNGDGSRNWLSSGPSCKAQAVRVNNADIDMVYKRHEGQGGYTLDSNTVAKICENPGGQASQILTDGGYHWLINSDGTRNWLGSNVPANCKRQAAITSSIDKYPKRHDGDEKAGYTLTADDVRVACS